MVKVPSTLLPFLALCVSLFAPSLAAAVSESPYVSAVPLEGDEDYQDDYDYEYSDPTKVDTFTTQEDTTTPSTTTSPPLQEGQIAWAPYSMRQWRTDKVSPVNLPSFHTGMTLPPVKGRWLSRNKETVQLINTKPAFIFPQVPLLDQDTQVAERKGGKNKKGSRKRVRRGSGRHNNNYVALCGGVFRDLYGIIQSPEYPLYYPNNKQCFYDIEVPAGHTLKLTCERFIMQGGENCTHDHLMVDFTGDLDFSNGKKFCGGEAPVVISNGTRMTIKFMSDDLFRYQGFSCRYRALLPSGDAVPGTFGNSTDSAQAGLTSNNFLQVVQCPSNTVVTTKDPVTGMEVGATSGQGGAASLYSGVWDGTCGKQNNLPPLNRIVGGYTTKEHEFPWMAAVLRTCETEWCHICGATIISEEWILTGAHCMAAIPMEELGVLVGDHSLFTVSTSQKFIKIKEKIIHPDYYMRGNVSSPLNNDIGLLRLEYPIIFTSQISPLCLPALGETGFGTTSAYGNTTTTALDTEGLEIVGKNATVLGWGMIDGDGNFAESLRGVQV